MLDVMKLNSSIFVFLNFYFGSEIQTCVTMNKYPSMPLSKTNGNSSNSLNITCDYRIKLMYLCSKTQLTSCTPDVVEYYIPIQTIMPEKYLKLHRETYRNKFHAGRDKLLSKNNSERSEECIDFTMIITSRNNALISNFGGGFRWKSEYPWCIIEFEFIRNMSKLRKFAINFELVIV
ncbi:hypothetical protein AGLY_004515 [Aphis glycines]|uniref:Uncharacterized protein n=1 Tax=Aphis glycines TaxID=307491 RepID=A0A6G0TZN2_APHGL|nr:hypothetical protein AGLY_004515 [Aphis glycines]